MFPTVAIAMKSNKYANAWTIEEGLEKRVAGHVVRTTWDYLNNLQTADLLQTNNQATIASLTPLNVQQFFEFLEGATSFGNNYRAVKDLPAWRDFYHVNDQMVPYIHKFHGQMYKSEPVVACQVCGVVLPLKVVTIDHKHPLTGGALDGVAKIFRGLGLTVGGPKGQKVLQSQQNRAAGVGGTQAGVGSMPDRRTLNEAGIIYYTMFKEAKQTQWLWDTCMHNYLNLRPACGPCNSSLRNSGAF